MGIHGEQIAAPLLQRLINIGEALSQQYDVVVTNPPYMGASGMNARLAEYVKSNYPNTKSDMSTVFMEKTVKMCKKTGYMSMINIPVWMFLSSYEKLRESLIAQDTFANMVHFGRGVFGSDFGTTAFVIAKAHINGYKGTYCRLFEKQGAVDSVETKEKWFLEGMGRFVADQSNFSKITGSPVAYWTSQTLLLAFENWNLSENGFSFQGIITGDVNYFLRLWHEVESHSISFGENNPETLQDSQTYYPYIKGGSYRKWYGNLEYVLRWENNGANLVRSRTENRSYFFKPGITWSLITSSDMSFRWFDGGFLCDVSGSSYFPNIREDTEYILAFLNSAVSSNIIKIINPTINLNINNLIDALRKELEI